MSKRAVARKKKARYDIDMSRGESNLNGLFKEVNHLIEQVVKSNPNNNSEISLAGEIKGLAPKNGRLIYGFSIKLEKGAKK